MSFLEKLRSGWKSFFRERVALVAIAYALLWLSVLSPHGVLLTGFLNDGWDLPEWEIGAFRGLGAVFGLLATFCFPVVVRRFGVTRASLAFLVFEAIAVSLACAAFFVNGRIAQIGFLALILLSRIGLYGFSLGEVQIRQEGIDPHVRGQVNGFANALTGIATLLVLGMGAALPSSDDFGILVIVSTCAVIAGLTFFAFWQRRQML